MFFNGDGSENVGDDVTNSSLMTPAQRTKKKAMEKLVGLKDGVRFLFKFECCGLGLNLILFTRLIRPPWKLF